MTFEDKWTYYGQGDQYTRDKKLWHIFVRGIHRPAEKAGLELTSADITYRNDEKKTFHDAEEFHDSLTTGQGRSITFTKPPTEESNLDLIDRLELTYRNHGSQVQLIVNRSSIRDTYNLTIQGDEEVIDLIEQKISAEKPSSAHS